MWTSDVYIKEWMWAAHDIPLTRVGTYGQYIADVPRGESLESQGLVAARYRAQSIWPYWPADRHVDRGTSSFQIVDYIMEWPGAEVDDGA